MSETFWLTIGFVACQFVTLAVVLRQNGAMADRLLALVDVDSAKVVSAMRNPTRVQAQQQTDAPRQENGTPTAPLWAREHANDFVVPPNEA